MKPLVISCETMRVCEIYLKSDYVIINGVLAKYYGIEGVQGDVYRKVLLERIRSEAVCSEWLR